MEKHSTGEGSPGLEFTVFENFENPLGGGIFEISKFRNFENFEKNSKF